MTTKPDVRRTVGAAPSLRATKGHGTENDFVIIRDLEGALGLSSSLVAALCDRRSGIGADGVLRVVRTSAATEPDVVAQAELAEYFMDYRNADGSLAEMCGNGVRVFARYLLREGLVDGDCIVATRGGPKPVSFDGDQLTVEMGRPSFRDEKPVVSVPGPAAARAGSSSDFLGAADQIGIAIDLPNPHVVVELDAPDDLEALDLTSAPRVEPALPDGQNVEFIVRRGAQHLAMRVYERGVGETRSCGTGICAAVVAAAEDWQAGQTWTVDVPGGRCLVGMTSEGCVTLTGPAVLVADFELAQDWLATHR